LREVAADVLGEKQAAAHTALEDVASQDIVAAEPPPGKALNLREIPGEETRGRIVAKRVEFSDEIAIGEKVALRAVRVVR
jgi:hypothetical protein